MVRAETEFRGPLCDPCHSSGSEVACGSDTALHCEPPQRLNILVMECLPSLHAYTEDL